MGGFGSGRTSGFGGQTTLEETRRIDIRYMRKKGLLRPYSAGTLSWKCGDDSSGYINYSVKPNGLELRYRVREYNEEWESVKQFVLFDYTSCLHLKSIS
jgi:hypothetical protein